MTREITLLTELKKSKVKSNAIELIRAEYIKNSPLYELDSKISLLHFLSFE